MNKNSFGRLPSGVEVFEYHINYGDFSASVIDFGATLRTLSVFGVDISSFPMAFLPSYPKTSLTGYRNGWRKTKKPLPDTRQRTIIC